jgi:outer membrane protein TolC
LLILALLISPNNYAFGEERVALSLSACLEIGLANNLDIKIAKIEPLIKAEDIKSAKSIFDTVIEGKIAYEEDERATASTLAGTETIETDYELGVSTKLPISGTEIDIDYSDQRNWTDSTFVVNNPLHTAELSVTVTQPVLKNFFGYIDRGDVKLSKIEAELADIESLDRIENTIADIEKAYWKLVFAEHDAALKKELLKQAKRLHEIFQEHLKTGFAESTEAYGIESNMQIRKTEYLIAKNDLKTAGNNLKLFLNEGGDFSIAPKSALTIFGEKADFALSMKDAFSASRDYRLKKKNLDAKKIKLKMKGNNLWPEVDLVGTLAVNGVDRKFGKASGRLTTDKNSMYYGGIEFTMPLENRDARSEYNKANLEKEKAILELLQTEKDLATDIDEKVRNANLNLESAKRWARIRSIEARKFIDEEKKLMYGRSDSKTIIDYQNDLTRAALSEYQAIRDYYFALIDLENAKDTLLAKVGVLRQ